MIASTTDKGDLLPVLEMIFYQNNEQAFVEYAEIKNLKRQSYKPVTYEGLDYLFNKIKKKINKENTAVTIGFRNIIPRNVLYFDTASVLPHIVWFKKAHKNTFIFMDGKGFINYPHLIFALKNNVLKVYSTKTANINEDTELYKAPFPNVYSGSNICMGTINLSKLINGDYDNIIRNMEQAFFGSKFTAELMDENRSKSNTISTLKNLLKTELPYPKKTLVSLKLKLKNVLR